MSKTEYLVYLIEILGTIAFASSGALVGIERHMDIFGVGVLGITTAVGGGIIRDIVLGITPPNVFRNSSYVLVAIIVSILLFLVHYIKDQKKIVSGLVMKRYYDLVMLWLDAVGLGIFTVVGINVAVKIGYQQHFFLLVFVGTITGIGGGVLRDVMAMRTPYIFVKHIYASASLAGAVAYIFLMRCLPVVPAMAAASALVVLIRVAAVRHKWNLPKV